ncbi:MAG: ATP-binding cassette domain-containing protein [Synergistaceae bacterium]|jgi:nickel transport system ATP-binding protein|nr:ATP-binding cassette domain-containing protein [Synergistaceae bacterium]
MSFIELKGVQKSYRQGGLLGIRRRIGGLNGLDLKIMSGGCRGLLGASGCGKSTTGRLILGLEQPDEGHVLYKGRDLRELKGAERREFRRNSQVVFQNSHGAVNPRFQAWKIIGEPLMNFEKISIPELRVRAAGLLKKVGLSETDMDKLPHQFSGGELQRVCIARALALSPEFILFDEAVSALDMLNQSLVLELLMELKRSTGTTFLFISHDMRVLLKVSDSIAVMEGGRISFYADDLSELETSGAVSDPALRSLAGAVLPPEPL